MKNVSLASGDRDRLSNASKHTGKIRHWWVNMFSLIYSAGSGATRDYPKLLVSPSASFSPSDNVFDVSSASSSDWKSYESLPLDAWDAAFVVFLNLWCRTWIKENLTEHLDVHIFAACVSAVLSHPTVFTMAMWPVMVIAHAHIALHGLCLHQPCLLCLTFRLREEFEAPVHTAGKPSCSGGTENETVCQRGSDSANACAARWWPRSSPWFESRFGSCPPRQAARRMRLSPDVSLLLASASFFGRCFSCCRDATGSPLRGQAHPRWSGICWN